MWLYFKIEDFACRCGCGKNNVPPGFIDKLDCARVNAGVPFKLNRGCSCLKHNRRLGSKDTSSHVKGIAVDIEARSSVRRYWIIFGLIVAGFTRIGIGRTFIHADSDPNKAKEVVWLY